MRPKTKRSRLRQPHSLRVRAYEEIKRRIITTRYRPGDYLNVEEISDQLSIGRTPVHQALVRLMHEGMLEIMPRKGIFVRPISLDEVLQIIDVRLINETHCGRLASQLATEKELQEMRTILNRAGGLIQHRDLEGLMTLDRDFHVSISRAAKNIVLADILLSLHERSLRFWFISLSEKERLLKVQAEHERILEQISSGNPDGAADAIREHIESFRETIARSI